MPLPALDGALPEQYYLRSPSQSLSARYHAIVEGAVLPLNEDLLVEASVLDALFEARRSGVVTSKRGRRSLRLMSKDERETVDISATFAGASLLETCCFLRWMYQSRLAAADEFQAAAEAGALLGVMRLAHKLDASDLLERVGSHLTEAAATASSTQLLDCIYAAEACNMKPLVDACLDSLAGRLVAERPWPASVDGLLAALDKPMLVDVMGRMGSAAAQRALAGQPGGSAAAAAAEVDRQLLTTAQSSLRVYSLSADADAGTCTFEVEVPSFEYLTPFGPCAFSLAGFDWEVNFNSSTIRGYAFKHGAALGFDLQGAASRCIAEARRMG